MADVITGNTQLAATKNDLIIGLVQKELKFAAKLLPFVTDFSAFAGKGQKSVSVPKLSSFTVQNRASAVAGDVQTLTSAVDTIDLDIKAYISWLIDSNDETQTSIDAQIEFAKRAASAHGRYVDEQILSVLDAAGLDLGNTPITKSLILDMRKQLLASDASMDELVLVASVEQESKLLAINEFTSAEVYGAGTPIASGVIGRVYGVPVVIHNGVAAGKAYMWAKSGVGIAFQKAPMMAEQAEVAYGTGAKRVAIDQLFGVEALQKGEKGVLATQSPLITYLNV